MGTKVLFKEGSLLLTLSKMALMQTVTLRIKTQEKSGNFKPDFPSMLCLPVSLDALFLKFEVFFSQDASCGLGQSSNH